MYCFFLHETYLIKCSLKLHCTFLSCTSNLSLYFCFTLLTLHQFFCQSYIQSLCQRSISISLSALHSVPLHSYHFQQYTRSLSQLWCHYQALCGAVGGHPNHSPGLIWVGRIYSLWEEWGMLHETRRAWVREVECVVWSTWLGYEVCAWDIWNTMWGVVVQYKVRNIMEIKVGRGGKAAWVIIPSVVCGVVQGVEYAAWGSLWELTM